MPPRDSSLRRRPVKDADFATACERYGGNEDAEWVDEWAANRRHVLISRLLASEKTQSTSLGDCLVPTGYGEFGVNVAHM